MNWMVCRIIAVAVMMAVCISPGSGSSIVITSGGGGGAVSASERYSLDHSTSLQGETIIGSGGISQSCQAAGSGDNSLERSVSGNGYTINNVIQSSGSFDSSTSTLASPQEGSILQGTAGDGMMSVSVRAAQGSAQASQVAAVAYGALASVQGASAGGGVSAGQSTAMAGLGGAVEAFAEGDENEMVAAGGFSGPGVLTADLSSTASDRGSIEGRAALDGRPWIDGEILEEASSESGGMGVSGLRETEMGAAAFQMYVVNRARGSSAQAATSASGGSSSSYLLTGYRWNQNDPRIQLYLNPTSSPSGITASSSQSAIAAAANTWDDAVAKNLFADGTTVIVDSGKVVDNPFSSSPKRDGYNVNGWWGLGSYLGLCRWWTNGVKTGGYYQIIEADVWYNKDKQWTTDWNTAVNYRYKYDLQSVALHELGHAIGMGDIYSTTYGGKLPPSDPRTKDFEQVMNLYDGPQRTLGNGDRTGAQRLYGAV